MIRWIRSLFASAAKPAPKPAPKVAEDFGDEDVFVSPEMVYLQQAASEMAYKIRAARKAEAEAARQAPDPKDPA